MSQINYQNFADHLLGTDIEGNPKASVSYTVFNLDEQNNAPDEEDMDYTYASSCLADIYYTSSDFFVCDIRTTNPLDGSLVRMYNDVSEWLKSLSDPQKAAFRVFNLVLIAADGEPYAIEMVNPVDFSLTFSNGDVKTPDTIRFVFRRSNLQCCAIAPSDEIK